MMVWCSQVFQQHQVAQQLSRNETFPSLLNFPTIQRKNACKGVSGDKKLYLYIV